MLDQKYNALVFGLDARIHVHIKDIQDAANDRIVVESPQFRAAEWKYSIRDTSEGGGGVNVTQVQE